MKKKRKFNVITFIKNWIPILIVVFIIMIWSQKKEDTVEGKTTKTSVAENVLIVELQNPEIDSKVEDWNLRLVNKENEIPQEYHFDLQEIEGNHKVDSRVVEPLKQMLTDARKQGLKPIICSSYRSTRIQTSLFEQKVRQYRNLGYESLEAKEKASYWVTPPKTSEHEIGIAVDIVSVNYQNLDERQEKTAVQKWLMQNCNQYGFILRYPTHKKEITKINYEPWHYRYVGIENAKFITEKGLCLEEYIDYLKKS